MESRSYDDTVNGITNFRGKKISETFVLVFIHRSKQNAPNLESKLKTSIVANFKKLRISDLYGLSAIPRSDLVIMARAVFLANFFEPYHFLSSRVKRCVTSFSRRAWIMTAKLTRFSGLTHHLSRLTCQFHKIIWLEKVATLGDFSRIKTKIYY